MQAEFKVKSDTADGLEKRRAADELRLADLEKKKQELEVRDEVLSVLSVREHTVIISDVGEEDGGGGSFVESPTPSQV